MSERPIIFSAPMVRAILEGRKTQTRLVLKPPIPAGAGLELLGDPPDLIGRLTPSKKWGRPAAKDALAGWRPLPYQPGDLLWVRETWGSCTGCNPSPGAIYRADGTPNAHRWRPSIHMTRWASRITLRVTDVRVQRVQEISEDDAKAEGVLHGHTIHVGTDTEGFAVQIFAALWNSIHAKRPERMWAANPWVAAISFERVKP